MEGIIGYIEFRADDPAGIEAIAQRMLKVMSDGEELRESSVSRPRSAVGASGLATPGWEQNAHTASRDELTCAFVGELLQTPGNAPRGQLDPAAWLLERYRANPEDFLKELRGTFAVIIADARDDSILAATDHIGVRPLYWLRDGDAVYISSRLKSIAVARPGLEINPSAIYAYMQHSMIPTPMTVYQNVRKLAPGTVMRWHVSGSRDKRYWRPAAMPKMQRSTREVERKIYEIVDQAIDRHGNSVPDPGQIGCFLSGGTDSSTICGLFQNRRSSKVRAYSIGFPENGYDEMFYARTAARQFQLEHREFYVKPEDVFSMLPGIAAAFDEPFGNASVIPTFFCARYAKSEGMRYLLAGDGGDEVFAGNDRYGLQQLFRNYFRIPQPLRRFVLEPLVLNRLERTPIGLFRKAGSYMRRANMPEVERIHSYRYVDDATLFSPDFLSEVDIDEVNEIPENHFDTLMHAPLLDRHLYMDMHMTIADNDLRKVSRMCELAGVRVRYPLLDADVVELGFHLPAHLKLKGVKGLRHVFKRAFSELLPKEVLEKEKHGFGLPISEWLRNDEQIKKTAKALLFDSRLAARGYFNEEFLTSLWELQLNDKTPYYGTIVWQLIMLEAWHRVHLEGEDLLP